MNNELSNLILGIELGSTRIKAILIDSNHKKVAEGYHNWESELIGGHWSYPTEEIWIGLQTAYKNLKKSYESTYRKKLTNIDAIGFSAMMHGYLPFNDEGEQLVPFRTWQNTSTEKASEYLSKLFKFNIPQRWSISHLYQAIINKEEHLKHLDFMTTLAGYVHWQLTDEKILGIGEASGMFPIDSQINNYNEKMIDQFNQLIKEHHYEWSIEKILPEVKVAGEHGGYLTEKGAKLLDVSGNLKAGIPLAPSEGDAGTGMIATNSIEEHTGNISAGTSVFSMIVLEEDLSNYYVEIDMVTTPTGSPVAMIHCNNFTVEINHWVNIFKETMTLMNFEVNDQELYTRLFQTALDADPDLGKIYAINYQVGEPITGFEEGRPLLVRHPESNFNLSNFMKTQIYSAIATLKLGMDILIEKEQIEITSILGHGGFFKTKDVGQQLMADALNTPISTMPTASEGGPWGMAILAKFMIENKNRKTLESYLKDYVFTNDEIYTLQPEFKNVKYFDEYIKQYKNILKVERSAINNFK